VETNQNIREFVRIKTAEYDLKFTSLETATMALTNAVTALTTATNHQTSVMESFLKHWQQAVPIKLVFWLTALIVGGTASISVIRFLMPTL
jgi:hypothetical protein